MKITKQQLKRIIKEEIEEISEAYEPDPRLTRGLEKSMAAGEADRTPEEIMREEVQDIASKFGVDASVEIADDGRAVIVVHLPDGETVTYNDSDEMYDALSKEEY
jgi:hypothetical protein